MSVTKGQTSTARLFEIDRNDLLPYLTEFKVKKLEAYLIPDRDTYTQYLPTILKIVNQIAQERKWPVKYGDIVHINYMVDYDAPYLQNFIWSGTEFLAMPFEMEKDYDEGISLLPSTFTIGKKVSINYWSDMPDDGNISFNQQWLNASLVPQVLKELKYEKGEFIYESEEFSIVFMPDMPIEALTPLLNSYIPDTHFIKFILEYIPKYVTQLVKKYGSLPLKYDDVGIFLCDIHLYKKINNYLYSTKNIDLNTLEKLYYLFVTREEDRLKVDKNALPSNAWLARVIQKKLPANYIQDWQINWVIENLDYEYVNSIKEEDKEYIYYYDGYKFLPYPKEAEIQTFVQHFTFKGYAMQAIINNNREDILEVLLNNGVDALKSKWPIEWQVKIDNILKKRQEAINMYLLNDLTNMVSNYL